jgi:hypothetical protein
MQNPPLSPDDLFRFYQRGVLDPNSLMTNILLILIEQQESQEVLTRLLVELAEELDKLALDMEVLAQYLEWQRPSQQEPPPPPNGLDDNGQPPDEPQDE